MGKPHQKVPRSHTLHGLSTSIHFYNVLAVSTLSYVSQLIDVPPYLLQIEKKLLPHIIPSPGSWVDPRTLHNIRAILPFRANASSIELTSIASKSRVLLHTLPSWKDFHHDILHATTDDEGAIIKPHPQWIQNCAAASL